MTAVPTAGLEPTRPGPAPWADTSVLANGGLGFIGSNLARHLVVLGASVVLLDDGGP